MSKMTFEKFKVLARKVFPTLPSNFEEMPDTVETYQLVYGFCSKFGDSQVNDPDAFKVVDLFSVTHWTITKLDELGQMPKN